MPVKLKRRTIPTSLAHRAYTLIKMSYPLFGIVFLYLFSVETWFETDLSCWGIPIIIAVLVIAHGLLIFIESEWGCRMFSFITNGAPLTPYMRWITVEQPVESSQTSAAHTALYISGEPAFRYGLRRVMFSTIDQLDQTIWGNLLVRSRAFNGAVFRDSGGGQVALNQPDVIAKLPFGAVSSAVQKEFVELARSYRSVAVNKRLAKRLESKIVKGEDLVQALGAVFLCFVLFDLGYSICVYLEMLKNYHLAQVDARHGLTVMTGKRKTETGTGSQFFDKAEQIRAREPGISLVNRAVMDRGFSAATVLVARAEALWYMNRKQEALESLKGALEHYPKSLQLHAQLARWLAETGNRGEAEKILSSAIDSHDDSVLPRLYMLVNLQDAGDIKREQELYREYLEKFDVEVFGEEPSWPPGGNRRLHDMWSRDDVHFLLDRLTKSAKAVQAGEPPKSSMKPTGDAKPTDDGTKARAAGTKP